MPQNGLEEMEKRADAVGSSWRVFTFLTLAVVVTESFCTGSQGCLAAAHARKIIPSDLDGRGVDFYPTLGTMETRCAFKCGRRCRSGMEYEEDEIVSNMVGLYERLRNELGADFRGMDPIDSRRAPIAMLILQFAAQNLSIAEIESAVRSALRFPNIVANPSLCAQ